MSLVVRGGVGVVRRFSVDTTGLRVDIPPRLPFPTNYVVLRNRGSNIVRVIMEEEEFALAPSEVHYYELAATATPEDEASRLEIPLELTTPPLAGRGLWLRSASGTNVVEVVFFEKR